MRPAPTAIDVLASLAFTLYSYKKCHGKSIQGRTMGSCSLSDLPVLPISIELSALVPPRHGGEAV
jgi:hypothetical protein